MLDFLALDFCLSLWFYYVLFLAEVSFSDGNTLASDWGCPFFETSAKNKKNVDQLFAEIVRETNYMSHPQKGGGCCTLL